MLTQQTLRGSMHRLGIERARNPPDETARERSRRAPIEDGVERDPPHGVEAGVEIRRRLLCAQDRDRVRTQVRVESVGQALRRSEMLLDVDVRNLPHRMHACVCAAGADHLGTRARQLLDGALHRRLNARPFR